jgi:transcription elongation factor Elf1
MGRRKRRVVKIIKKKLPTIFTCPVCGEESVKVIMKSGSGNAVIQCGSCKLKEEIAVPRSAGMIDAYCIFTDKFHANIKGLPTRQRFNESI